jgi:hypothetical protein
MPAQEYPFPPNQLTKFSFLHSFETLIRAAHHRLRVLKDPQIRKKTHYARHCTPAPPYSAFLLDLDARGPFRERFGGAIFVPI